MPRLLPLFLALLTLLCWTSPAWATERLAVLELTGKSLTSDERAILTDTVRGAVVKALGGRIQVMTRENMEVMMADMGMDATCVSEGACEVETARNLGVDYVISGTVATMSGTQVVSLKLLETRSGQMLGSEQVKGANALELMDILVGPAGALVGSLGGAAQTAGRPAPGAAVAPAPAMQSSDFEGLKVTGELTSATLGKLVCIGPGSFTMGSPETEVGRGTDETQHRVTLTQGFCVMEHEVTQGDWVAFGNKNPSKFKECGADCPVEQVSWYDAVAYANAVSAAESLTPAYAISGKSATLIAGATGYRLPTEAEWEAAARGGQASVYSGSEEAAAGGWIVNSGSQTHGVCGKQANRYGLCDMTGNVWEWTGDWYGEAYPGAVADPTGATSGPDRVNRGGSWCNTAQDVRVANRGWHDPAIRYSNLGFRLSRSNP